MGNEMDTGFARDKADAIRRKKNYKDTLQLKIDLENKYEDALRDRFHTESLDRYMPVTGPPLTSDQEALSSMDQNALLLKNLQTWNMPGDEANKVVNTVSQSSPDQIKQINMRWSMIDKKIRDLGLDTTVAGSADTVVIPFFKKFIEISHNADENNEVLLNLDDMKTLEKTDTTPAVLMTPDAIDKLNDNDPKDLITIRNNFRKWLKSNIDQFKLIEINSDADSDKIIKYYDNLGQQTHDPLTFADYAKLIQYESSEKAPDVYLAQEVDHAYVNDLKRGLRSYLKKNVPQFNNLNVKTSTDERQIKDYYIKTGIVPDSVQTRWKGNRALTNDDFKNLNTYESNKDEKRRQPYRISDFSWIWPTLKSPIEPPPSQSWQGYPYRLYKSLP